MDHIDTISSFVEGAPPGEVGYQLPPLFVPRHGLTSTARRRHCRYDHEHPVRINDKGLTSWHSDIKALTISTPHVVAKLGPAFEKYNEEQFTTVKLPGSSQHVRQFRIQRYRYQSNTELEGHRQLAQLPW